MATTVSNCKGYACTLVCTESINVEIFAIILEVQKLDIIKNHVLITSPNIEYFIDVYTCIMYTFTTRSL